MYLRAPVGKGFKEQKFEREGKVFDPIIDRHIAWDTVFHFLSFEGRGESWKWEEVGSRKRGEGRDG